MEKEKKRKKKKRKKKKEKRRKTRHASLVGERERERGARERDRERERERERERDRERERERRTKYSCLSSLVSPRGNLFFIFFFFLFIFSFLKRNFFGFSFPVRTERNRRKPFVRFSSFLEERKKERERETVSSCRHSFALWWFEVTAAAPRKGNRTGPRAHRNLVLSQAPRPQTRAREEEQVEVEGEERKRLS